MAGEPRTIVDEGFRLLGRVWTRLFWTVLLVVVVLWDVSTYFFGPLDFAHVFGAGLATGMIVSGSIAAAARIRYDSPPA